MLTKVGLMQAKNAMHNARKEARELNMRLGQHMEGLMPKSSYADVYRAEDEIMNMVDKLKDIYFTLSTVARFEQENERRDGEHEFENSND